MHEARRQPRCRLGSVARCHRTTRAAPASPCRTARQQSRRPTRDPTPAALPFRSLRHRCRSGLRTGLARPRSATGRPAPGFRRRAGRPAGLGRRRGQSPSPRAACPGLPGPRASSGPESRPGTRTRTRAPAPRRRCRAPWGPRPQTPARSPRQPPARPTRVRPMGRGCRYRQTDPVAPGPPAPCRSARPQSRLPGRLGPRLRSLAVRRTTAARPAAPGWSSRRTAGAPATSERSAAPRSGPRPALLDGSAAAPASAAR